MTDYPFRDVNGAPLIDGIVAALLTLYEFEHHRIEQETAIAKLVKTGFSDHTAKALVLGRAEAMEKKNAV